MSETIIASIRTSFSSSILLYNRPKFTFIVVQKRGSTRFFWKQDNGYLANPPVGTVVDHSIVKQQSNDNRSGPFDFYLISQETRLGTVTPTHYFVLTHPENGIPLDRVQALTYRFTHLYYNWPVRIKEQEQNRTSLMDLNRKYYFYFQGSYTCASTVSLCTQIGIFSSKFLA